MCVDARDAGYIGIAFISDAVAGRSAARCVHTIVQQNVMHFSSDPGHLGLRHVSWPLWHRPASGMQLWQMVDRMAARATALCLLIISASHVSLLAHPSHHPMHPHHSHSRVTV